MENKINIAELLKDCPQGMELDCTMYDRVTFDEVTTVIGFDDKKRVKIILSTHYSDGTKDEIILTEYGTYTYDETAKCVIFPKGKTTWEGFVPPCKFKDGDVLVHTQNDRFVMSIYKSNENEIIINTYTIFWDRGEGLSVGMQICCYTDSTRLATEEEKEKLLQAIKDNGYKWNAETKTLEKLIEPKFKEIHFYKDLEDELEELGKAMNGECAFKYYRSHNDTMREIKRENPTIHTYAISALDMTGLLDRGYKIFLHENGRVGELHLGATSLTDKELRRGHNAARIWIGGGFENFFYR